MGMGTRALGRSKAATTTAVTAVGSALFFAAPTWAQDLMGQPTPGGIDLQPAAAPLKHDAIWFHDIVLMPVITGITLLVLGLLAWIVFASLARTASTAWVKADHSAVWAARAVRPASVRR